MKIVLSADTLCSGPIMTTDGTVDPKHSFEICLVSEYCLCMQYCITSKSMKFECLICARVFTVVQVITCSVCVGVCVCVLCVCVSGR
jgi:hypothetical protein